jgi:DNA invertase Pin-like site-specific DNA recombinase
MNCILYARVSTDRQAEKDLSIPAQLQLMRDYARQHDWRILEEFVEPGASAKTTDRPALQQLLSRIRSADTKIGVLLVHKIDRLARNVFDHATIRALLQQRGIRLASVVENVDDSVSGQLVENIMASMAQFYSANLSAEVKQGLRKKVIHGGWPHLPPCGYVQVKKDGRGSRVEVHPRLGPLVTRAFELYATGGYSLNALSARLATEGMRSKSGERISASQMQRILSNRFYIGRLHWKNQDLPGEHKPLVSEPLFARVQELVGRRYRHARVHSGGHCFPLRTVAVCASCRGRMLGEQHDQWGYYRCSRQSYRKERCAARFCNARRAHADLERISLGLQLNRAMAQALRRAAAEKLTARETGRSERLAILQTKEAELSDNATHLTEAFAIGDLSAEDYAAKTEALRAEQAGVRQMATAAQRNSDELLAEIDRLLDLATTFWDLYAALAPAKQAELLKIIFSAIVVSHDGIVGFSFTPPFRALFSKREAAGDPEHVVEGLLTSIQAQAA